MGRDKSPAGFTTIEIVAAVVVVAVVGLSGWWVWQASHRKPGAKSAATTQTSQQSPGRQPAAQKASGVATYTSAYEGFNFSYPVAWQLTSQSNDDSSNTVTLKSGDGSVTIAFGVPVNPPTVDCGPNKPAAIIAIANLPATNSDGSSLYLVKYDEQGAKGMGITDNGGATPQLGSTGICGYVPTVSSKRSNELLWFRISSISDAYAAMSDDKFFSSATVLQAQQILGSGNYR